MTTPVTAVGAADARKILDVLARYAHVIDNRDWSDAPDVFTADVQLGQPSIGAGIDQISELIGDAPATHGHNTTDVVLSVREDGSVRAWSKFFIVRGDGTVGSGDYQDTLVRTPDGWRIAIRAVSRGNRLDSDPTGGPSTRTLSFASWLDGPDEG